MEEEALIKLFDSSCRIIENSKVDVVEAINSTSATEISEIAEEIAFEVNYEDLNDFLLTDKKELLRTINEGGFKDSRCIEENHTYSKYLKDKARKRLVKASLIFKAFYDMSKDN